MNKLNKTENFNTSEGNVKEDNIFYKDCCDKFIDYVKKSHNEQNLERVADVSKTLTEQWKKGELPSGMYYIEFKDGDISKDVYAFGSWGNINEHFLKQVLAPVPSYEEWKALEDSYETTKDTNLEQATWLVDMEKENARLKELLKECEEALNDAQRNYGYDDSIIDICSPIITKIDNAIGE